MLRLLLLSFVFVSGLAVELGTTTYSLTYTVKKGEFERTKADVEKALVAAKAANSGPALELLLRSAFSKVSNSLDELVEKQEVEAKLKETAALKESLGEAVPFVNSSLAVKALKGAGVGKGGKAVKRVSLSEFHTAATEKGGATLRKWLKAPLLITDGVGDQALASRTWTAEALMSEPLAATRLKYVTPAEAKKLLTFDQDPNQPQQEVETQMVSFERYFANCFNLRAKPDFRRKAGADTEHCEQVVPAASLLRALRAGADDDDSPASASASSSSSSLLTDALLAPDVANALGWAAKFDVGRASLASAAARHVAPKHLGLQGSMHGPSDSVDVGAVEAALLSADGSPSRAFVLGPAGSGEQIRQPAGGIGFADALIHGKRRWFFMTPEAFTRLRSKEEAAETLEPSSAFVFFENQLEELREDVNLGSLKAKLGYVECLQQPGDVLLVPEGMVMTSLAIADALSYRTHAVASGAVALQRAASAVWLPEGGALPNNYRAMACFDFDLEKTASALGGGSDLGYQAQIVQQVMQQMFGSKEAQTFLQLSVLAECAGVFSAEAASSSSSSPSSEGVDAAATPCLAVWAPCADKLERALPASAKTSSWLPKTAADARAAAAAPTARKVLRNTAPQAEAEL